MDNKRAILIGILTVLILGSAAWLYLDYRSASETQIPPVPSGTPITEERIFVQRFARDSWPAVSQRLPVRAGESGMWFIDAIRLIGPETMMVAFEDGLNGHTAIIASDGLDYEIKRVYESQMQFTPAELETIEGQYGKPGYAAKNFRVDGNSGLIIEDPAEANAFLRTATTRIKIALLNPGGNLPNEVKPGDVSGCDHVVLEERVVPQTQTPLTAALNLLLSEKTVWTDDGDIYNYLAQGNLVLDSVSIVSGTAIVRLTGAPPPLAGVCDDPRLFIQVAQTARQFPTVQRVEVYVNGTRNDGRSDLQG